jgi:phospholipase/carboxylesterase
VDAGDGRLRSRLAPARSRARWPPGLRQLSGGCLLLVPEQAEPDELLVFFHGAGGEAADGLALVEPLVPDRGLLVLLPNSRGGTWDLVQGRTGPDAEALDAGLGQVMAALDVRRVALAGFSDGGGLMPCHQAWPTGT